MIYNDPLLRGKKPEPVKPVKPEVLEPVSDDIIISQLEEMLYYGNGCQSGWLEKNPYVTQFQIPNMQSSSGATFPADVYMPWTNYYDIYGDITFTLSYHKFFDGETFFPFITSIEPQILGVKVHRAYIHNILAPRFIGSNTTVEMANSVPGLDVNAPFSSGCVFAILSLAFDSGDIQNIPLETTVYGDDLIITMPGDICSVLSDYGCTYFGEGYRGYVG